jgi:dipeptidyl aminopeptidase/acylaminoacyl peptidase
VSSPEISPDGKRVIYEQSRTNWESNSFDTELWIADAGTGELHLLMSRPRQGTRKRDGSEVFA